MYDMNRDVCLISSWSYHSGRVQHTFLVCHVALRVYSGSMTEYISSDPPDCIDLRTVYGHQQLLAAYPPLQIESVANILLPNGCNIRPQAY